MNSPRRLFGLLLAVLLLVLPARAVEKWDVFELALAGPADGNPFLEVELSARFTQGARTVTVAGFYDGDGVYKVRFMPDTEGAWRYETSSNRPALAGRTGNFDVTAAAPGNHGPVRVAHTFHFAHADGTPFRQLGTTAYHWTFQSEEQQERTLKTLAAAPFNKLRMCILPNNRRIARFPFVGTPPRAWDLTRFNPEYFRHFEQRVRQLRDIGVEADVILFHPYDRSMGFGSMDAASDDRFVRYVVARLAAYRNVWWSISNEYDFNKDKTEADWDRLFKVVQAADPYGRLLSIHNGFQIYNHTQPWVTHASLQQGAAVTDPERALIYRDVYRKPIVFDEVKYEGQHSRRWGRLKPEEMVLRFWVGTVAGTYVGHSETMRGPDSTPASGAWLSSGGALRGESVARIAFLKQILADAPPEGIEPIDKWQERRMGGKAGEYYLVYLGEQAPTAWPFTLYKAGLIAGMKFSAEIIDTWNMTVTPVDGLFEIKEKDDYDFVDKDERSIALPGKPYLALRLRRVGPLPEGARATADPVP
jgi:hypothetical protein